MSCMLHIAIDRFIGVSPDKMIFAGVDATGFETRHCTPYYLYRCSLKRSYTKMSVGSDMKTQLVCAFVIQHHYLISHDIKHFPEILQQMISYAVHGLCFWIWDTIQNRFTR